jgi:hypothetical protein
MRFARVVAVLLCVGSKVLAAPITGVAVTSVVHDASAVIVTITNTSGKDVTAFTLSMKETVSGEVQQSQVTRDFLHSAVVLDQVKGTADEPRLKAQFGPASLPSGQSYQEKLVASSFLTNVEAVLVVVAFSDKTAEATDPAALQRLIDARKANAATIQKCAKR